MLNLFQGTKLPDPAKSKIGLVAGSGELPKILTQEIRDRGYQCAVLSVDSDRQDFYRSASPEFLNVSVREGTKAIRFLKDSHVTHLVFAGKVVKTALYEDSPNTDDVSNRVMAKTSSGRGDERIMRVVESIARMNRFKVLGVNDFMTHWIPPKGSLGRCRPSDSQMKDIQYGAKVARAIGRLDIGQCVAVKGSTVMAVEGIEGTNSMIQRLKTMDIKNTVLVKVSKPQQNIKFDMPVIGTETLKNAAEAGCSVIVVEAGRTLLVQYEQLIEMADRHNMSLYGV